MKKPQQLRDHLVAAVPALADNPDRLLIFVEGGGINGTYKPGASFEYRYNLELVITDFAGAPEAVMVPLLQWLTRHQSELLANPTNRDKLSFEVDVMADGLVDLAIKLPLTERVWVSRDGDGNLQLRYLAEPATESQHADTLSGGPLLADGALIATLPAITA